jgi:hypothetical protein
MKSKKKLSKASKVDIVSSDVVSNMFSSNMISVYGKVAQKYGIKEKVTKYSIFSI